MGKTEHGCDNLLMHFLNVNEINLRRVVKIKYNSSLNVRPS